MLLASSVSGLFKWRQFEPEVILLAVGWYLRFSLSYRDVEELLAERGLHADHVTVWRWVQRNACDGTDGQRNAPAKGHQDHQQSGERSPGPEYQATLAPSMSSPLPSPTPF